LYETVLQRKERKHYRPPSHYHYPGRDLPHFAPFNRGALASENSKVQAGQAAIEDKIGGRLRIISTDQSVHISEGKRETHASRQRPSSRDIHRDKSQQAGEKCNHAIFASLRAVKMVAGLQPQSRGED
jgi:hypothetical protein